MRGSTPDQTRIAVDGFTLYQFGGGSGVYSGYNLDTVERGNLSSISADATDGGRLASTLRLDGRTGSNRPWSGYADVSALGLNAGVDARLGDRVSLLVAGRHSAPASITTVCSTGSRRPAAQRCAIGWRGKAAVPVHDSRFVHRPDALVLPRLERQGRHRGDETGPRLVQRLRRPRGPQQLARSRRHATIDIDGTGSSGSRCAADRRSRAGERRQRLDLTRHRRHVAPSLVAVRDLEGINRTIGLHPRRRSGVARVRLIERRRLFIRRLAQWERRAHGIECGARDHRPRRDDVEAGFAHAASIGAEVSSFDVRYASQTEVVNSAAPAASGLVDLFHTTDTGVLTSLFARDSWRAASRLVITAWAAHCALRPERR